MRSDSDAESARRRSHSHERGTEAARARVQESGEGRGDGQGVSREQLEALRSVTLIERNEYPLEHLPREKVYPQREDDDDAQSVCYCERPDEVDTDKKRCDDVSCLNFATYVECNPQCRAGEFCCNQRLQNPDLFPELEAFKTEHKGFGVRTKREIAQSSIVGEYVGEIIDQKELNRRLKTVPRHELNFYYLMLEPGIYIDARDKGSFTRFVNHSCEPNCKTEKWTVKGETRIAVIALCDIHDGDELTFDYQWKALGSRQIKCFCGSVNCKGIIGTEGDTLKDLTPKGFFKEPNATEVGAVLVDRRIRIYRSKDDHSTFNIATVKSYDESNDMYEVIYDEDVYFTDKLFDSPPSRDRMVCLRDEDWHVYVELDGMSEDQIEKAVFSIPKKRMTDSVPSSRDPSPKPREDGSPLTYERAVNTLSSRRDDEGKSTESNRAPRRNHDGDLLDVDGSLVTNKILVKSIPLTCTEAALRKLFILDERRSFGMGIAPRPPPNVLVDLDMFFFDDASGWALVELNENKHAPHFLSKLHNRDFQGQKLRVFKAGRKEVDSFVRAKRNFALRKHHRNSTTLNNRSSADTSNEKQGANSEAHTNGESDPKTRPYCFGRKLNWYVSIEQMENSPTRRAGISASLEENRRIKCVKGILHIVKTLHLDREDATSAIISLNRYFTFHAMNIRTVEIVAAATLHLFMKAHSRRCSWHDFVNEVHLVKSSESGSISQHDTTQRLDGKSPQFQMLSSQILATELEIMEGLRYDLCSEDPYALMDVLTAGKNRKKFLSNHQAAAFSSLQPPLDVQREAKHLLAETLRLPIWVQMPVECIVLGIVYLSAAVVQALQESTASSAEPANGQASLPSFLPQLDGKRNELETLQLLECALSLVESLKDRWTRLEKNAKKESRQSARNTDEWFDTEEFAVSRQPSIEIGQRITHLLKTWISIPTSMSMSPMLERGGSPVRSEFITFAMLGQSSSEAQRTQYDVQSIPTAASVVPITMKKGPSSGNKAEATGLDRLHASEIVQIEKIRKRTYLGAIVDSFGFDIAGKKIYLQPWPYRDHEPMFSEKRGMADSGIRELSCATMMRSHAPAQFVALEGIIFPTPKASSNDEGVLTNGAELDPDMLEFSLSVQDGSASLASSPNRLENGKHYLAFEQPLHTIAGILEAKQDISMRFRKKALYDMVQSLVVCHHHSYVHRFVAPCHLFVFKDGIKLAGYHAMRKTSSLKSKDGSSTSSASFGYTLSDNERKELVAGSWLHIVAPEILLGDVNYTWRCDIWSAGCVALAILLHRMPFLQGQDVRSQLNLIFRLCGTPFSSWEEGMKLPHFAKYRPKNEYKMRLRKTMQELKTSKYPELPEEAFTLLEAMLQMDPSKRLSAKKLLEMDFFAEVRGDTSFDFSDLKPTFSALKKKFEYELKTKAKRRRVSSFNEQTDKSNSSSRHSSRDDRSKPKQNGSRHSEGHRREKSDVVMAETEDVPLPESFQFASADSTLEQTQSGNGLSKPREKRAKLGWGMGLHAANESQQSSANEKNP